MQDLSTQPFFQYLSDWQKNLVRTSYLLLEREQQAPYYQKSNGQSQNELEIPSVELDYSFIVFPMAKAYEGFLKQFLFDLRLIDQRTYEGRRFRIGRALNPDIYENHRDEYWLFDDVSRLCGQTTAKTLWDTWLICRNRIFHFFPKETGHLDLKQAEQRLTMMAQAMLQAVSCVRTKINH